MAAKVNPDRASIDATADEVAALLGVDPEKVGINYGPGEIVLTHALARRLLALGRKNEGVAK